MNKDKRIVYMICNDKQIKMTRDVFDYLMTVKHYNKKLKEEIIKLQQDLDKAIDTIEKDRQFNQGRLLDVAKLKKENEQLNNIINTFEDDLEREVNISEQESMVGNYRYTVIHSTLEKMLKYFKELKESKYEKD